MKVPKARRLPAGMWYIQLRLGGKSIIIKARTEKECTRQAQLYKSEYLAGKRVLQTPEQEKFPTLEEAIKDYIAARSNTLSPATIRGYETILRNRFKGLMARSLSDISPEEWVGACNHEAALCSAKTLKNTWGFLISVYKNATGMNLPEVRLPQVVPNERPFLDADQIKAFIAAVRGDPYEIPYLLALSSLRRSEIMALRWEHVDLRNRRILVKGAAVPGKDHKLVQKQTNKNKSSTRYIPILMDELYKALSVAQNSDGLIVTCCPETLERRVQKICRDAGLPPVGLHGLRHSFASLAYHLNVPEKITMEIGGWSDNQTMRKIYTHISQKDMERYIDAFGNFFSENAK